MIQTDAMQARSTGRLNREIPVLPPLRKLLTRTVSAVTVQSIPEAWGSRFSIYSRDPVLDAVLDAVHADRSSIATRPSSSGVSENALY